MLALALLLSMIKFYHFPNGGSITAASMAPIIIISLMYDTRWALFTSFAYSLLQMLEGFYPPPVQSFGMFVALILLDYVVAFGILGLAGPVAAAFKRSPSARRSARSSLSSAASFAASSPASSSGEATPPRVPPCGSIPSPSTAPS